MDNKEFKLGELILIEHLPVEKVPNSSPSYLKGIKYIYKARYRCFCGNEFITDPAFVKCGDTKSCGCLKRFKDKTKSVTHGQSKTKLYKMFYQMHKRCYNVKTFKYSDYGGRGIKVCKAWHKFENFHKWAMNNGYIENLSIDRKNPNGNYTPKNCWWTSNKIQSINKRNSKNNTSGFRGVIKHGNKWKAQISINNQHFYLGSFNNPKDAANAYEKARENRDKKYHKEFQEQQLKNKK